MAGRQMSKTYSNTWLNWPPMSPPYRAGQTREPEQPADFISEIMKRARHFRPFKPENRINRGRFNQVVLYVQGDRTLFPVDGPMLYALLQITRCVNCRVVQSALRSGRTENK
jgi:hypothetical protein